MSRSHPPVIGVYHPPVIEVRVPAFFVSEKYRKGNTNLHRTKSNQKINVLEQIVTEKNKTKTLDWSWVGQG